MKKKIIKKVIIISTIIAVLELVTALPKDTTAYFLFVKKFIATYLIFIAANITTDVASMLMDKYPTKLVKRTMIAIIACVILLIMVGIIINLSMGMYEMIKLGLIF